MKVTIRDVAREAGVSVATVSRVLNSSGPVRERTRERIREVAAALQYTPNGAARSLSTRRASTLGVILPGLDGEFFSEVIRGIDQAARQEGYHLLVSSSHNERSEVEAAVRTMRGRVDGLILMSPGVESANAVPHPSESLPVVLLNSPEAVNGFDCVTIDNYGGAATLVRHLIAAGHERIAIINGADGNHDAGERARGYRDALAGAGLECRAAWELRGDFAEESGHRAAATIVGMSSRPTAIFAANDSMAVGALSALGEAGIRVPEDIAIGGFDDIPIARYMSPPLTSVHVPMGELGRRAVATLLRAVESGNQHQRTREVIDTALVVRRSCGGAAIVAHADSPAGPRSRAEPDVAVVLPPSTGRKLHPPGGATCAFP
ncbi:MAG: LacI family DNA-binding transcriptional regulator [Gemmatimonadaceae bacterium]